MFHPIKILGIIYLSAENVPTYIRLVSVVEGNERIYDVSRETNKGMYAGSRVMNSVKK